MKSKPKPQFLCKNVSKWNCSAWLCVKMVSFESCQSAW